MRVYLKHFYLPSTAFLFVILISIYFSHIWIAYDNLLLALPYVLFISGAIVALYLLQYAIVYTCILFAFTYALIQLHLQLALSHAFTYTIYVVVNFLFPLLLLGCVFLGKKTLKSIYSISLILVFASLLIIPWIIEAVEFNIVLQGLPENMFMPLLEGTWFSYFMLVTYVPVTVFLVRYYFKNPVRLHALWIVGLIAVFVVFVFLSAPLISAITFTVFSFLVLVTLLQEAFTLAFIDELTGIASRKALQKLLLGLGKNYSIAMIDVDHFKGFNDTYGHDVGDQVLKMVATKIDNVDGGGKAYRYGGEEFIVVFPTKTMNESLKHLETLRMSIAKYMVQIRSEDRPDNHEEGKRLRDEHDPEGVNVTVSMGVAQRSDVSKTPQSVIKVADKALYRAKQDGRNCIRVSE